MRFEESLGAFTKRLKSGEVRKPLRTFKELCEELGVPIARMRMYIRWSKNPPKKKIPRRGVVKNTWYDPDEFKKWFSEIKDTNV